MYTHVVAAPPLNVQATQTSASAPVEVSWSPPIGGAATITGYRIFYGGGENVSVPPIITFIGINLTGNQIGRVVSIRAESAELLSELTNVTIIASKLVPYTSVTNPEIFCGSRVASHSIHHHPLGSSPASHVPLVLYYVLDCFHTEHTSPSDEPSASGTCHSVMTIAAVGTALLLVVLTVTVVVVIMFLLFR